jgi:hypothetical protein
MNMDRNITPGELLESINNLKNRKSNDEFPVKYIDTSVPNGWSLYYFCSQQV